MKENFFKETKENFFDDVLLYLKPFKNKKLKISEVFKLKFYYDKSCFSNETLILILSKNNFPIQYTGSILTFLEYYFFCNKCFIKSDELLNYIDELLKQKKNEIIEFVELVMPN
ncbi:MAG: hypothetical protein K2X39_06030 [Silvanigrellaceae bacterium]|nr:hypothetical protein [Silvanigrellaceae bacterium]